MVCTTPKMTPSTPSALPAIWCVSVPKVDAPKVPHDGAAGAVDASGACDAIGVIATQSLVGTAARSSSTEPEPVAPVPDEPHAAANKTRETLIDFMAPPFAAPPVASAACP